MKNRLQETSVSVVTIGHSTRELGEFVSLLLENGVLRIVDVRTVPRSRHNPQFNRETLPAALEAAGIGYLHLPELGGLRRSRPDSPNGGWRNASFRGYTDYMQTDAFASGVERLLDAAKEGRIALMCAEAVPWRCHRSLIADALVAREISVEHILGKGRREVHALSPMGRTGTFLRTSADQGQT
ncbi:MAG: DUF488 domain-containing protein [Thermodesulfobacteriota bacterium]